MSQHKPQSLGMFSEIQYVCVFACVNVCVICTGSLSGNQFPLEPLYVPEGITGVSV